MPSLPPFVRHQIYVSPPNPCSTMSNAMHREEEDGLRHLTDSDPHAITNLGVATARSMLRHRIHAPRAGSPLHVHLLSHSTSHHHQLLVAARMHACCPCATA
ncbi:hypothetical protein COCNU_scaffold000326G000030 [Cocos nucifera]|nr:hypothetical protein [Cocos nucifera]